MASSSYYYNLFLEAQNREETYARNKSRLEKIRYSLEQDTEDFVRDTNIRLSSLDDMIEGSIRYNENFHVIAQKIKNYEEESLHVDPNLKLTMKELTNEIQNLDNKRSSAHQESDYYYRRYVEESDREREEAKAAAAAAAAKKAKKLGTSSGKRK